MFDMTLDEMLYNDVKKNRHKQIVYKRLLFLVTIIIIVISSITLYRTIYPPHIDIISSYKGTCDSNTVSIYKDSFKIGSGEIIESYNIASNSEVRFDFGTYCVPLSTSVSIIDDNWKDAVVKSHVIAPGFTIEQEHFFGNLRGDIMYIDTHQTITLIEDKSVGIYRHSASSGVQYEFPYPIDNQLPYMTELIKRDKYDVIK